ncbi:MAG: F0F1 ATP synthase subunit B [Prevotellaceae bacterium]|nr:F0F1 ATP synthase subunit B [Prevotellaceae bacterium]MDO4992850.1 F0F1 ATP synthase subunit B [Prevotellaceae bacterium]
MDSLNLPAILTPDFGLLFWMFIAFVLVFAILAKFGFPVITGMVDERKKFIDESLKNAHEAAEKLANIQQESEAMVQQAREQQSAIIKDAGVVRDGIIAEAQNKAKAEAARILEEAQLQIEREKQAAIRDIRAQVAQLSVQIAEKVVRANLSTDAQQMQLIDRMLDEVQVENK